MPTRRPNWYNLHSTRRYPLDDKATGTDDSGYRLPNDILLDAHLRFPTTAGRYAFLAGLTVSPQLVTMVFLATDDVQEPSGFTPLAAVTLTRSEVRENVHVPVKPLLDGVGGFVVLGDTSESFVGRFSYPTQSLLAPRAARGYDPLPVTSVRKLGTNTSLQGLVTLKAGTDVEIVKALRDIDGVGLVDAMVIRLKQVAGANNVLEKYIGPCDVRPESRNCDREGVESINEAVPDCDGNIDICFQNLKSYPYASCGGQVLTHPIGITEVCAARDPERFSGQDLCLEEVSSESSLSSLSSESSAAPEPSVSSSISSGSLDCADLPYCENFDDRIAQYFTEIIGLWGFDDEDSPAALCSGSSEGLRCSDGSISSSSSWFSSSAQSCPSSASECPPIINKQIEYTRNQICEPYAVPASLSYTCRAGFQRNVSVWDACAYASSLDKRVTTDLQLTNFSTESNGGIVVNYHLVDPLTNPHIEYFHAILDRNANEVQLWLFTGVAPIVKINSVALSSAAILGDWYRMEVETQLISGSTVNIKITVTGVTDPSWPSVVLNTTTTQFLPDDGLFGLGSIRGYTRFSFFDVEDR